MTVDDKPALRWIRAALWGTTGWAYMERAEIGSADRQRIERAAGFILRCLANNQSADTERLLERIWRDRVKNRPKPPGAR